MRTLYSDFEDQEFRRRAEFKLSDGDLAQIDDNSATWTDIEISENVLSSKLSKTVVKTSRSTGRGNGLLLSLRFVADIKKKVRVVVFAVFGQRRSRELRGA